MKSLFTRMFCCKSCPNIVKTNNFMNFQSYFLQKVKGLLLSNVLLQFGNSPKQSWIQKAWTMFLKQWCRYHQWGLNWCLVVFTEPLNVCCPAARPGILYSKQWQKVWLNGRAPKHAYQHSKKPPVHPCASYLCLLHHMWPPNLEGTGLVVLQIDGPCQLVWWRTNIDKHWARMIDGTIRIAVTSCYNCKNNSFPDLETNLLLICILLTGAPNTTHNSIFLPKYFLRIWRLH